LAKAGYEVHLFAQGNGKKEYQQKGVIIHPLPECQNRRQRYSRASSIAQMAADLKPDLFHVHEPDLLRPVITHAGTRPVVYDVHEAYLEYLSDSDWIPKWAKPLVCWAWDRWERRLVKRCAGVITVTEPIARRYAALHDNVHIVANYPDWQTIQALPPPIERDGATCVFAGAIRPDRGISEIFKALAILKERGLAIPFILAGWPVSDEYVVSLWKEAKGLGIADQVQYQGVLSKSEALIMQNKASIGLITYFAAGGGEIGMPNKLVECMALGLPVVFSDFPTFREVAGVTGAGIMVDPTKPEQIADAIETLVRSPTLAKRMGEAGRRAVRERFSWDGERIKLLQLYHHLVGTPHSKAASLAMKS
jgi:glycosyltransferase involved in cell wall biosynthesis